ncbi:MAG: hypothetical protein H7836_11295 [Magnetococcus sp. YQC-3]
MNRPRNTTNTPTHIDAAKLPQGVWYQTTHGGRWVITERDEHNKRRNKRLCSKEATLAQIWQAYENRKPQHITTFATLSNEYQQTLMYKDLSPLTQKDYQNCHNKIVNTPTANGLLGNENIKNWTKGLIRKLRDKRGEESKRRANKELTYIKLIFNWAFEYEKIKENPATGISKLKVEARQHYAEDKDYDFMLSVAKESAYDYLPYAMEIAYLCRMRLSEVLDLTDASETPDGLIIKRRKGSKTNITELDPRLKQAWQQLKQRRDDILSARKQPMPINANQRYLFISSRTGDKLNTSSLETAMTRVKTLAKEKAQQLGIEFTPFVFHDLKRKGVSDTTGDKLKASGHRSASMLSVYDVKPDKVKPTR